jgi:hypothetical protein
MRLKVLMCVAMLAGAVSLFGQETKSDTSQSAAPVVAPSPEAAPAPAPAPAPEVAPVPAAVPAPVVSQAPEGIKTTFYGMAMYRFRWIAYANYRKDQGIETATDYQNKLAYKAGVKVKVNDEVSGQFEAGNDWYGTESVEAVNKGNFLNSHRDIYPYFSLAYMKWNPGCFFIDVGIIPVPGSSLLDLIGTGFSAADINSGTAYQKAAHTSWGIITNFSLPGARLGMPILKEDFKLGVELVTSVLEERTVTAMIPDSLRDNNSGIMLMAGIPMSTGLLTLKPSVIINFSRFYRDSASVKDKADNEYGLGVEAGYKVSSAACVRLGLGYAHMANKNSRLPAQAEFDEEGVDGNIGTTLALGPGKLDCDFTLSTDENSKAGVSRAYYPFVDVKYGWAVNKNFTIKPRTRLFFTRAAKNDSKYVTKFVTWPEIILYGEF